MTTELKRLVRVAAHGVVADTAAEELPLFDDIADQYFVDPDQVPDPADRNDPLGFGMGTIVAATPAALAMVYATVNFLRAELLKSMRDVSAEWIHAQLESLIKKSVDKNAPASGDGGKGFISITREQLIVIERLAKQEAIRFGMDNELAAKMARSLLGSLATK